MQPDLTIASASFGICQYCQHSSRKIPLFGANAGGTLQFLCRVQYTLSDLGLVLRY